MKHLMIIEADVPGTPEAVNLDRAVKAATEDLVTGVLWSIVGWKAEQLILLLNHPDLYEVRAIPSIPKVSDESPNQTHH